MGVVGVRSTCTRTIADPLRRPSALTLGTEIHGTRDLPSPVVENSVAALDESGFNLGLSVAGKARITCSCQHCPGWGLG